MAQYSIEPPTTPRELRNAARLVRARKKAKGYTTDEQVARAMGMPYSDLSRLLNSKVERKWGFFRLSRVAAWLGVTIDEMLGRPNGKTKVVTPTGEYVAAETATLDQAEALRVAEDAKREADEAKRALAESAKILREVAKHAEAIRKLLEVKQ